MIEFILSAVISSLTFIIGYIVASKKAEKLIENTKNDVKNEIISFLNSTEGQKFFFAIGALIGNGAKSGLGMTKRSGKFKLEDLFGQVAASFIQQNFLGGNSGPQKQSNPRVESPQLKLNIT